MVVVPVNTFLVSYSYSRKCQRNVYELLLYGINELNSVEWPVDWSYEYFGAAPFSPPFLSVLYISALSLSYEVSKNPSVIAVVYIVLPS